MEVVVGLVEGDGVAGIGKTTGDGWSRASWVLTVVMGVVVIPVVGLGFRRGKFLARKSRKLGGGSCGGDRKCGWRFW
ncbi:pollen-specific leucine-rich repeat extensin-like protein 3 [Iris pallida]|uniref:Pollen-specific leucine-rich repeat extensin-like protein 3 n=1 Tax=Iris pallida TaxID=29817 RepID=A0AAX6GJ23_IRIPA|nr:pollen-specific leucine-rich repeat extensin-like protein 3 [Iris pallida]